MWYLSISHISFPASATAVILHRETFFCRVTYDEQSSTAVRGAHGSSQFICFYLLDIFIRRLLVRLRPDLFGAFLINHNFFFARKNCSLGSFRTLCIFTVVGRYCSCLTCVFVCFHFIFIVSALFQLQINFRRWLCTSFSLYFLISHIFKIRVEFF